MLTNAQIEELKQIDVRAIAQKILPPLLSGVGEELKAPCFKCGGTDRLIVKTDKFFCRAGAGHCGAKGDGIKLVQLVKGLNFKDACAYLAELMSVPSVATTTPARPPKTPAQDWKGGAWQDLATTYAAKASELLPKATIALNYLSSRGLTENTITDYRLGYTGRAYYAKGHPLIPAIALPWWSGDLITCVKHRFLKPPGNHRYGLAKFPPEKPGSVGEEILFMPPQRRSATLAIVEGEFNAMSIYQASEFDPVSIGSQGLSKRTIAALVELAPKYDRVLVWTDEPKISAQIESAINHSSVTVFCSPVLDGAKYDANKLLQTGQLGDLLADLMPPVVTTEPPQSHIMDVTDYTGRNVSTGEFAALQARLLYNWRVIAQPVPGGYHIEGFKVG